MERRNVESPMELRSVAWNRRGPGGISEDLYVNIWRRGDRLERTLVGGAERMKQTGK